MHNSLLPPFAAVECYFCNIHMLKANDTIPLLGSATLSYGQTGLHVTAEHYCAANVSKHTEPGLPGLQKQRVPALLLRFVSAVLQ